MHGDADRRDQQPTAPAKRGDDAGLRGPERSSQPPHSAAEEPRKTKKSVYIQPRSAMRQSQVVVKSALMSVRSGQGDGFLDARERDSGSQNTLKAVGHADTQVDRQRLRVAQASD